MTIRMIQGMPWYLRLITFSAIAVGIYFGFWYLVTRDTRLETKRLNEEIAQLRPRNAQAQIASQRLNEFRAIYAARQEEFNELKALLPEQREITMVLQGVQDRAKSTGLSLRKFMPREDIQEENYSGKRIDVSVASSFSSLRSFFEQIAHYQRIVSITNFELRQSDKQSPTRTVDARFDLTAYYVSAEKPQTQPASPAAGSGGATPPAPATRPATK